MTTKINEEFTTPVLIKMVIPIVIEQFLALLVGIADTMMISYAGEAAVSGVSLINQLNNVYVMAFSALAMGGAVIVSQYMGIKDVDNGCKSFGQLILTATVIGAAASVITMIFAGRLFGFLFGNVEHDVAVNGLLYFKITICSYPAIAVYTACAGVFRSMQKTRTVMNISILMNLINVAGNAIGIFVLHAGVVGVAVPSLISWVVAAVIMLVLARKKENTVYLKKEDLKTPNKGIITRIFKIAIPNGIEESLFQVTKVVLTIVTALFTTSQIAAYGIAQSFWILASLSAFAMSPLFIAVVGRSMGAGDTDTAEYYCMKLIKMTFIGGFAWNVVFSVASLGLIKLYDLDPQTAALTLKMIIIYNIFYAVLGPVGFALPSGLRAAGDVKYVMMTAIFSTVICRIILSIVLAIYLNLGVIGILYAMIADWAIKNVLIWIRFKSGKWKEHKVI